MSAEVPAFEIVQATGEHLEPLVQLFDGYRQFYEQASDLPGARQFLQERLANGDSVIFIALGGARRGLGFTQLYPSFSSVSMRRLWILNDLFVAPEARGKRVAAALLERAKAFAFETHAKGLTLSTQVTNTTAQRLYEQHGYTRDDDFYAYSLLV